MCISTWSTIALVLSYLLFDTLQRVWQTWKIACGFLSAQWNEICDDKQLVETHFFSFRCLLALFLVALCKKIDVLVLDKRRMVIMVNSFFENEHIYTNTQESSIPLSVGTPDFVIRTTRVFAPNYLSWMIEYHAVLIFVSWIAVGFSFLVIFLFENNATSQWWRQNEWGRVSFLKTLISFRQISSLRTMGRCDTKNKNYSEKPSLLLPCAPNGNISNRRKTINSM